MAHKLARIDFMTLFREYAEMPVWQGAFDAVGLPIVKIRWSDKKTAFVRGSCRMKRRSLTGAKSAPGRPTSRSTINVTIVANSQVGDVIQTVLHEMTHAAGWMDHSHRFYNALREAVAMATGVDCDRQWTKVYEYDEYQRQDLNAYYGDTYTGLPLLKRPVETRGAVAAAKPRRTRKVRATAVPKLNVAGIAAMFDID